MNRKECDFLHTVCEKEKCTGCKACVSACPQQCITYIENLEDQRCVIDETKCVHCNLCKKVCLNESKNLMLKEPVEWKQGWSMDAQVRSNSSSGGIAAELSQLFLKEKGIVYSCVYDNGKFIYQKASKLGEHKKFIGSKYVKSDPGKIYLEIKSDLANGEKVLFIGLPCHVAGLKLYLKESLQKELFTVDLICHGTPSAKLFESFVEQYHCHINELNDVQFRVANQFSVNSERKSFAPFGTCDRYTIGFLNALFYTKNCYSCKFAGKNRVSDITIGDSWGSNLSIEEQKKGISLIICQTEKGKDLLHRANLFLTDVDVDVAIAHNHQLERPVVLTEKRKKFFNLLYRNKSFNSAVFQCYPYQCIKQKIKSVLIKLKILEKWGGGKVK